MAPGQALGIVSDTTEFGKGMDGSVSWKESSD